MTCKKFKRCANYNREKYECAQAGMTYSFKLEMLDGCPDFLEKETASLVDYAKNYHTQKNK